MAMLAKDARSPINGASWQWRDVVDRISVGTRVDDAELAAISQRYAIENVSADWTPTILPGEPPVSYSRTHSTGAAAEALPLIIRSWTQSLTSSARILDLTPPELSGNGAPHGAGAFDAAWHWEHPFVDVPPFKVLAERYQPRTVLDIGCGTGAYLRLFRAWGATEVFGVDGIPPEATVLGPGEYAVHDLTTPLDLGHTFDLVICSEVAEHLEPVAAQALVGVIARHARSLIVFSAAETGQPGNGHINCQPLHYWLALWQRQGWRPDTIDSLGMRAVASLSWLRRNLIVLHRQGEVRQDGTTRLEQIAERRFTWYGQTPGIRETAFGEVLLEDGGGYQ
jgi:SAM-dependent methyltransferase